MRHFLLALPITLWPLWLPSLNAQKATATNINHPTGPGTASSPRITASGSSVHAIWSDNRGGYPDIYYNRSLDGGATWLPSDVRLDSASPPGWSTAYSVVCSGTSVYVTWMDDRNQPTVYDIYFNRSLDEGTTWLPADVRLDVGTAPGAVWSGGPKVAAIGSSVYVAWQERSTGATDIYFNRSLDSGTTWLPVPVRLDVGSAAGAADSGSIAIAASGTDVYVAWADKRNSWINRDIYFNRSPDSGSTWLTTDVRLNTDSPPGTSNAGSGPRLATAGPSVYVAWGDAGGIRCNRSLDRGTTWLSRTPRLDVGNTAGAADGPSMAASGSSVYVTWGDQRGGFSYPDIYCNVSQDGGATWLPTDIRLDVGSAPGAAGSFAPQITAQGSSVSVAWVDYRNGSPSQMPPAIYYNRSIDGGRSWLPVDGRLDVGSPPSVDSGAPGIASSAGSVYVAWTDRRNGGFDIYFNLASGFQPYGPGTAGTLGITPVLSGAGNAAIGGVASLVFDRGLGGTAGLLGIGDGPASRIALPAAGGTLYVNPTTILFLLLGGADGVPGAGTLVLQVPVPANPNLLGLNANFQGVFLDSGAVGGISMSNALETWIG